MKLLLALLVMASTALAGDRPDAGRYEGVSHDGPPITVWVSGLGADFVLDGLPIIDLMWDFDINGYRATHEDIVFFFLEIEQPEGGSIWFWEWWIPIGDDWIKVDWGQMAHS